MTIHAPWAPFRHPSVRDLAWLLLSPRLFLGQLAAFPAFRLPQHQDQCIAWLADLDKTLSHTPEALPSIQRQGFRRLGLYCEALLAFYFEHCGQYNRVEHNVRVQGRENTLGEYDFLLADHEGHTVHVELAVKFYLQQREGDTEWHGWLGPNAIDRLDIKLERMINHQLALPHRHDARDTILSQLTDLDLPPSVSSQHWIAGVLLFPHEAQHHWPQYANTQGLWGTWMPISQFLEWADAQEYRGNLCDKMAWLSGPERECEQETLSEIITQIHALYTLARNEGKSLSGLLIHFGSDHPPIMVVDDHWPETSSPSRRM